MSKQAQLRSEDIGTVKTLKIGEKTHQRLKKFGRFGDSFEDILNRLMDIAEGKAEK